MTAPRPRRLALVAVAALLGAPFWVGSFAHAQSVDRVSFTGGCDSTAAGAATANPDQIRVRAGATLELVNEFGEPAVLSLDGVPAVELVPGGATGVVLHHGPVTATMRISCPDGEPAASVTIAVTEANQPGSGRPWVGDPPDAVPGGLIIPRPDDEADPGDDSSPGPGPEASPDATGGADGGDTADTEPAATGSGWGAGPEGLLAVIAALCVVGVSVAAFWVIAVRRTVRIN